MQDESLQITDSSIIKQNIYFSISSAKGGNQGRQDSLREAMFRNTRNSLGIERIKEIRVGYPDKKGLAKWKEVIKPSLMSDNRLWKINDDQSIRFIESDKREVNAVVLKVKSLKKAKDWLSENKLLGKVSKDEIALDSSKTFGLLIFLTENQFRQLRIDTSFLS
jgi:hypothetical protein